MIREFIIASAAVAVGTYIAIAVAVWTVIK